MSTNHPIAPMDRGRAFQINALLVNAWMLQNGMERGKVPSLHGVPLADAMEATLIVQSDPGIEHGDGSRTITCCVEPTMVSRLYAWVIWQTE